MLLVILSVMLLVILSVMLWKIELYIDNLLSIYKTCKMGGIVSALPRIQEVSNEESVFEPSSRVPIQSQLSKHEPEEKPSHNVQHDCPEKQQTVHYEKWDVDKRRNHEGSMELFQQFNQHNLNQHNINQHNLSQQPSSINPDT